MELSDFPFDTSQWKAIMLSKNYRILSNLSLICCVALFVGCPSQPAENDGAASNDTPAGSGTPDEHADPHDVPLTEEEIDQLREETKTWDSAIARVQQYRDTIKQESTAGVPAQAHRPLDLLDHVLQWLPEIAQNSNIPKEQWETIGTNAQKLRDLFNQVHANIDEGKEPDYQSVSEEIDQLVSELAAIKPGESDSDGTN